jgi:hypothetical protein
MNRHLFLCLILLLVGWLKPSPAHGEDAAPPKPFIHASYVPVDVELYLHVDDATHLFGDLQQRPIWTWIRQMLESGMARRAWEQLVSRTQTDSPALFDACFGRSATIVTRTVHKTNDPFAVASRQWVLISEVDPDTLRPVLKALRPKHLSPYAQRQVMLLPEQDLLISLTNRLLIVGPNQQRALFNDVLQRLDDNDYHTLRMHTALAEARATRTGRIGAYLHHDPPMGGWSIITGDLTGDSLRLKHSAQFNAPPFGRPVTEISWDASILANFEDTALVAVMEPTDIGATGYDAFIQASLGIPLLSGDMLQTLGDTRLISIGEVEGRTERKPVDARIPTVCLALSTSDPKSAEYTLDRQVLSLAHQVDDRTSGKVIDRIPRHRDFMPDQPRSIALKPNDELYGGLHRLMEHVSINWQAIECEDAGYFVIASHPRELAHTVDALRCDAVRDIGTRIGRWASCGTVNGLRLAQHLASFDDSVTQLLGTDPAASEQIRQSLHLLSTLAAGIERCRWMLQRPDAKRMELEVELIIAPGPSTADPTE